MNLTDIKRRMLKRIIAVGCSSRDSSEAAWLASFVLDIDHAIEDDKPSTVTQLRRSLISREEIIAELEQEVSSLTEQLCDADAERLAATDERQNALQELRIVTEQRDELESRLDEADVKERRSRDAIVELTQKHLDSTEQSSKELNELRTSVTSLKAERDSLLKDQHILQSFTHDPCSCSSPERVLIKGSTDLFVCKACDKYYRPDPDAYYSGPCDHPDKISHQHSWECPDCGETGEG